LGWTLHSQPLAINSAPYDGRPGVRYCEDGASVPASAIYRAAWVHVPRFASRPEAVLLADTHAQHLEFSPGGASAAALHAVGRLDDRPIVVRASTFVVAAGGVETPRLLLLSPPTGPGNGAGHVGRNFYDHVFAPSRVTLAEQVPQRAAFPIR
jgi:choline dehydrogenase-like flavoprotein